MGIPTITTWTNWAGNVEARPLAIKRPDTIDALRRAIRDATRRGHEVRAAGAGHSFSPVCSTAGTLLDLSLLQGIERVDAESGEATVLAGTRLHALGEPLLASGRAIANQGDIDRQAIAGAVSTGTHGTGRAAGSFSAQVTALELVTPDGDLLRLDARDGDRFRAARLSLGMLGVLARVTIATVPAYRLRERTRALGFDEALETFAATEPAVRNAEFWWLPALDTAVLKTLEETADEPVRPEHGEHPPGTLARYLRPEAVDWSFRIYPNQRNVPFVELEYTLPIDEGPAAMSELRNLMLRDHPECTWAVEYRTQPGEDALLSPTRGRDSVTISVHQAVDQPWEPFFGDAERVLLAHDGRPHWGKLHFLDAARIAERYPTQGAFEAPRADIDPRGAFLNGHLRSLGFGG